jgi:hypothetical protein
MDLVLNRTKGALGLNNVFQIIYKPFHEQIYVSERSCVRYPSKTISFQSKL